MTEPDGAPDLALLADGGLPLETVTRSAASSPRRC